MSPLAAGLVQVIGDGRMVEPRDGPLLGMHRIREAADHQSERQDQNGVNDSEQNAGLEIRELVRDFLPGFPQLLEVIPHAFSLEECVDKWRDSGALRNDQKYGEDTEGDQNRVHPPALVAPEEGEQLSGNSETLPRGAKEPHISSQFKMPRRTSPNT